MSKLSRCPLCQREVTIPPGLDESTAVECPVCDGRFPLSQALAEAAEGPPELVPVESAADARPAVAVSPNESASPAEAAEKRDSVEVISEAFEPDEPELKQWEKVFHVPQIDTGAADPAQQDDPTAGEGLQFSGVEFRDRADSGEGSLIRSLSPDKKQKNMLRELVGIVLGGAGGVLLAYYGLNFFGGPRFDFAEIYLPGIEHTVPHRPDWWPAWARFERQPAEPAPVDGQVQGPQADEVPAAVTPDLPTARLFGDDNRDGEELPAEPAATGDSPTESEQIAVPAGYVSLADPPSFRADELGQALKAAHDAVGCGRCSSTGTVMQDGQHVACPDCHGEPPNAMTPAGYAEFCRLAEVITFVDPQGGGSQLGPRTSAISKLVRRLAQRSENVVQIGQLAAGLLEREDRDSSGILLAGTVRETNLPGKKRSARIKMAGIDTTVVVQGKGTISLNSGDRVLVLGTLVFQPEDEAAEAEPMVYCGLCETF